MSNDESNSEQLESMRMDFATEIVDMNDETQVVTVIMKPDPRRYDIIEKDGEKMYLDKYLKLVFGAKVLESMAKQSVGMPGYFTPPNIDNSSAYAEERYNAVLHELETGEHTLPNVKPDDHKPLSTGDTEMSVTFVSVDICGSTIMRANNSEQFDKTYEIFLQELGTVVGQFHGSIFKTTGDGFIAYVDQPSINNQCDNSIDMCLALLLVVRESLNKALIKMDYPELNIRVGADHGEAKLHRFNVPATGYSTVEVVSDALNRAVKIQESCEQNQFRIGRKLYEGIHVQWLERSHEVSSSLGSSLGIPDYQIYTIN